MEMINDSRLAILHGSTALTALLQQPHYQGFLKVACHFTCGTDVISVFCYLDNLGMALEELYVVHTHAHTYTHTQSINVTCLSSSLS